MALENYDVKESDIFIAFCDDKNLSLNSIKKYANALKNYTNFHELTIEDLLDEADEDEENNVRLARRRVRNRLITFRTHLIHDLGYKASTIKTNMICAKAIYRYYGIELPEIPNAVLTESPNDSLDFEDLPTIKDIRTAIESTKKAKHKCLFLFAACNGAARMELTNFSFSQFLEGVAPFCNKPKTPQDIIDDLDGKCEELEVIPVFKMKRQKTNYSYYAPITPECTQFCLNYLKAEGLGLKPEDHFFQLSKDGVSTAFKLINEKFNWGKRGLYGFFSSHRIRKFNASVIEDSDFANYIQGRKPNPIKETYFKKDINRVREEYKKHMHKFTIYAHYDVMINSDAYNELLNQKNELEQQLNDAKEEYESEIATLKASNNAMNTEIADIKKQMDNIGLETQMIELQKRASEHPLVQENPGLMEYVMTIFKDQVDFGDRLYYSDAEVDDMVRLALASKNMLEKREDVLTEEKLKEDYPEEMYTEVTKNINHFKEKFIKEELDVELSDLQNKKIDKALLPYKKEILELAIRNYDGNGEYEILGWMEPDTIINIVEESLGLIDSVEAVYVESNGFKHRRFR